MVGDPLNGERENVRLTFCAPTGTTLSLVLTTFECRAWQPAHLFQCLGAPLGLVSHRRCSNEPRPRGTSSHHRSSIVRPRDAARVRVMGGCAVVRAAGPLSPQRGCLIPRSGARITGDLLARASASRRTRSVGPQPRWSALACNLHCWRIIGVYRMLSGLRFGRREYGLVCAVLPVGRWC